MALLAAGFSMRSSRRGGVAQMIGGGVAAGFALFVLDKITGEFGEAGTLPVHAGRLGADRGAGCCWRPRCCCTGGRMSAAHRGSRWRRRLLSRRALPLLAVARSGAASALPPVGAVRWTPRRSGGVLRPGPPAGGRRAGDVPGRPPPADRNAP